MVRNIALCLNSSLTDDPTDCRTRRNITGRSLVSLHRWEI